MMKDKQTHTKMAVRLVRSLFDLPLVDICSRDLDALTTVMMILTLQNNMMKTGPAEYMNRSNQGQQFLINHMTVGDVESRRYKHKYDVPDIPLLTINVREEFLKQTMNSNTTITI